MRLSTSVYHPECFTCTVCAVSLVGVPFHVDADKNIYCDLDFKKYDESFQVYFNVFLLQEICSCVQRLQVCIIIIQSDVLSFTQTLFRLPILPRKGEAAASRLRALGRDFHPGCFRCEVSLVRGLQISS